MLPRLLLTLAIAAFVGLAIWDILRRNPHLRDRLTSPRQPPPGRRPGPTSRPGSPPRDSRPDNVQRGKVIELRRDPWQVLGVDRDISAQELAAHVQRLLDENDPERLAHMSDDLRAFAARRTEEVQKAYSEIKAQTSP